MSTRSPGDFITIREVVTEWQVTRQTVMNWLNSGLPSRLFEGRRYMLRDDVKAHFARVVAATPAVKTRRKNRREK